MGYDLKKPDTGPGGGKDFGNDEEGLPPFVWRSFTILIWGLYIVGIFFIGHWAESHSIMHLPPKFQAVILIFFAGLSFVMLFTLFEGLAAIFALNGNLPLAVLSAQISANIHRALSPSSADYARQLGLLGDIYLMQGNLPQAQKMAQKALRVLANFEEIRQNAIKSNKLKSDSKDRAITAALARNTQHLMLEPLCYETLASVHIERSEWKEAIEKAQYAVKKLEVLSSPQIISPVSDVAQNLQEELILKLPQDTTVGKPAAGSQQGLASVLLVLGKALNGQKKPAEAKVALKRALKIREEVSQAAPYRAAEIYLELAQSASLDNEPETARKYKEQARTLALQQRCYMANEVLKKIDGKPDIKISGKPDSKF